MPEFVHDGLRFHTRSEGAGTAVVWQHGLGGDVDQTFAMLEPGFNHGLAGYRFVGFDARAHGLTQPIGDPRKIAIATSADDLAALLDELGIERAVVGGISMGAAIALNFALRYPSRALGLVLARPAWLDRPFPEHLRAITHIAQYLRKYGAVNGLEEFRRSSEYQALVRESSDWALVAATAFESPRAEECVARLERIPHDTPCHDRSEWTNLRIPTLVLANHQDSVHPWELAETLARTIPGASLREITPKSVDLDRHAADIRRHLEDFLVANFTRRAKPRDASDPNP